MSCHVVDMGMRYVFFLFKQKTAYEMRISDWSSDVCSSDLRDPVEIAHDDGPGIGRPRIAENRVAERLNIAAKGRHGDDRHADRAEKGKEAARECEDESKGQAPRSGHA